MSGRPWSSSQLATAMAAWWCSLPQAPRLRGSGSCRRYLRSRFPVARLPLTLAAVGSGNGAGSQGRANGVELQRTIWHHLAPSGPPHPGTIAHQIGHL